MTTEALAAAGRDPTGIVGGRVAAWGGNLRRGGDTLFVVEADEYDRSFLALSPTVAVVTNVEADHLDIYADLDDIRGAFAQFASRARAVVLCADDAGAASIKPSRLRSSRYGIASATRGWSRAICAARTAARVFTVGTRWQELGRDRACAFPARTTCSTRSPRSRADIALGVTARGDGAGARLVRRRRAPLPAARRSARRRGRRRLRASPHRDSGDARRCARGIPRPADHRRLPAASLLAHARLRR